MGCLAKATMRSRFKVSPKNQRTVDGIVFDSKKEAMRYAELKLLERAGKILHLVMQKSFRVQIAGKHFCTYTADFLYYDRDLDRLVIEDVKSTGTAKDAAYKLRKKAAEIFHGIEVTEVVR